MRGLADGETFYTWQGGIPELREALARYHRRHFGMEFSADEFLVTIGGMQAIPLALQATVGAGDEAIYLTPAWPNFAAAAAVGGGIPVPVRLEQGDNGWFCDVDRIEAAVTPRTKAIFVNTPANPTGWTADRETLQAILDLARRHGLWIIADEIYALFHYGGRRAPSFMDIMEPEDRILFVNTFSKNWAMTGWRIGWLRAHPALGRMFENLVQYSTSGVAQFLQRGAIAALDDGDAFLASQIERAQAGARPRLPDPRRYGPGALQRAAGRILPVLLGRRRHGYREGRFRHRRQGQCRPGAGQCVRRGRRRLSAALLPPPPRPCRGSRQPAGGVDQEGLRHRELPSDRRPQKRALTRRTSAPAAE